MDTNLIYIILSFYPKESWKHGLINIQEVFSAEVYISMSKRDRQSGIIKKLRIWNLTLTNI